MRFRQPRAERASVQDYIDVLELGEPLRKLPVSGPTAGLGALLGFMVVLLYIAGVVAQVWTGSISYPRMALVGGCVAVPYVLKAVWRRFTRARGLCQCLLFAEGLIVTGLTGRVVAGLAWSEVVRVTERRVPGWSVITVHQRDRGSVEIDSSGITFKLSRALAAQAAAHGIRWYTNIFS